MSLPPDEQRISMPAAARGFPPHRQDKPVHPATIIRWITAGVKTKAGRVVRLEGVRCGSRWLTSRAAVERFMEAQTNDALAPPAAAGGGGREGVRQERVERELAAVLEA